MFTIAQIVHTYGEGGAERVAYNIGWGLKKIGIRSICISVRDVGSYALKNPAGIEVISLRVKNDMFMSTARAVLLLRKAIKKYNIDLLHAHGAGTLLFCVLATIGIRRPILWFTWHIPESFLEKKDLNRLLVLWSMRHCQAIFGDSQQIIDRITLVRGLTKNLSVFPKCVPDEGAMADMDTDKPTILWMARFVPPKNPLALLRAAALLKREGLIFKVILCGCPYKHTHFLFKEAQDMVIKLGISDIISMTGWVDNTQEILQKAAIGVQTSYIEGLSLTLLEQMMAGLAVVATDVGDTRNAVLHEVTGLLIPPENDAALTDALRRLILDKSLRIKLGKEARKIALEKFSINVTDLKVKEMLRQS